MWKIYIVIAFYCAVTRVIDLVSLWFNAGTQNLNLVILFSMINV